MFHRESSFHTGRSSILHFHLLVQGRLIPHLYPSLLLFPLLFRKLLTTPFDLSSITEICKRRTPTETTVDFKVSVLSYLLLIDKGTRYAEVERRVNIGKIRQCIRRKGLAHLLFDPVWRM